MIASAVGQEPIVLHDRQTTRAIHAQTEIFEDETSSRTVHDVIRDRGLFRAASPDVPNFGLSGSAVWMRFRFLDSSTQHAWLLNLDFPLLDEVDFFRVSDSSVERLASVGRSTAFLARPVPHRTFVLPIPYPVRSEHVFYLRVRTDDTLILPLVLTTRQDFQRATATERMTLGVYYGIMLAMFGYNFFLWLALRDRSYFFYISFVLCVALLTFYQNGLAYEWLAIGQLDPMLSSLASFFAILFARHFLATARHAPLWDRALRALVWLSVVSIGLSLAPYRIAIWGGIVIALAAWPVLIGASVVVVRQGFTPARYFLVAWLALLIGAAVNALMSVGWAENNWLAIYGLQLGTAIESLLLALGLAARIQLLRKEKESAEQELLRARLDHHKQLVDQLESQVQERTAMLHRQKQDLEEALNKLQNTEMQLIQSAKMSALGQLVAGIAHEINNPITFIYGNLDHLETYVEDLKRIVERMEEGRPDAASIKRSMDYDEMIADLSRILRSYRSGAYRIKDIVSDLLNFSHVDNSAFTDLRVNEELDMLAKLFLPQFTNDIRVHREFGDVPSCYCRAGQISQVFLNLIMNAADAVQSFNRKTDRPQGNVWIRSESMHNDWIRVTIKDDGGGIETSLQERIFNPFFTTKPVGQGTGLGLPIAYRLVQNHQGKLYYRTVENEGSEFFVELPTHPAQT